MLRAFGIELHEIRPQVNKEALDAIKDANTSDLQTPPSTVLLVGCSQILLRDR